MGAASFAIGWEVELSGALNCICCKVALRLEKASEGRWRPGVSILCRKRVCWSPIADLLRTSDPAAAGIASAQESGTSADLRRFLVGGGGGDSW
jgi:hypothetical protein